MDFPPVAQKLENWDSIKNNLGFFDIASYVEIPAKQRLCQLKINFDHYGVDMSQQVQRILIYYLLGYSKKQITEKLSISSHLVGLTIKKSSDLLIHIDMPWTQEARKANNIIRSDVLRSKMVKAENMLYRGKKIQECKDELGAQAWHKMRIEIFNRIAKKLEKQNIRLKFEWRNATIRSGKFNNGQFIEAGQDGSYADHPQPVPRFIYKKSLQQAKEFGLHPKVFGVICSYVNGRIRKPRTKVE